jgi:hypothetical protein
VKVPLDLSDIVASVGEEHDLLVLVHPLRLHQLPEPPPGLLVEGLHESDKGVVRRCTGNAEEPV